jgi:hypothetical protein
MLRGVHSFRVRPARGGFSKAAYPRVPTIVSAGVVAALLAALIIAGLMLSSELIDPMTVEEGTDAETLLLSGTVIILTIGCGLWLAFILRRYLSAGHDHKDPPVVA